MARVRSRILPKGVLEFYPGAFVAWIQSHFKGYVFESLVSLNVLFGGAVYFCGITTSVSVVYPSLSGGP